MTVSCFAAWLFQLSDRIVQVKASNSALAFELRTFGPNLERDVKFLRLADAHREGATSKLIGKLEAHFAKLIERQKLKADFKSNELTIRQINSLEIETFPAQTPLHIQIYVPEGKRAKWIIKPYDTLSDACKKRLVKNVLDFEEPIEIELPVGLSTMIIATEHSFTRRSKFVVLPGTIRSEFILNDIQVADVKAFQPIDPDQKYYLSGGLIRCVLPQGKANHSGLQPLHVASSIYQDRNENREEVRAETGFRCTIEMQEDATQEPRQ